MEIKPSAAVKENLRQRAYLNSINSWIDTIVKMIVGFVLNPYIVSALGPIFYGVWQIIIQLNSYMVMADLRSSTTLKWIIAKDRTTASKIDLRKSVTAALTANILISPLYLIAGSVIIWMAPYIGNVAEEHFSLVRSASALLVLAFIITQFLFIFDQVLTAMNLSYKTMGIRCLITLLGGVLTAGAIYFGFSLPGMAAVLVIVPLVSGIIIGRIVYVNVPWFGFARVTWARVISFIKLTGWFMTLKVVDTANVSIDLILLGYLAGPKYVTAYTLSRYLMQASSMFFNGAFNAITPGLSRLLGEKNFTMLLTARTQLLSLLWMSGTAAGAIVCLWNRNFITLWTSSEFFVGQIETFLIVCLVVLKTMQEVDGSIIIMTLAVKKNTTIGAIAAVITIILSSILIPHYQVVGLLVSLLGGTLLTCASYSYYTAKLTQRAASFFISTYLSRTSIVCIFVLAICGFLGNYVSVNSWSMLIGAVLATFFIIVLILWFIAMDSEDRRNVINNFASISYFKTD